MNFIDKYNDPIIGRKRSGTLRDPYKPITETQFASNGKIVLTEIPNRGNQVIASYNGIPLYEVEDGELRDNLFKVDYPNGIVFFSEKYDNKAITISYLGEGAYFFPSARVWSSVDSNGNIETVNERFQDFALQILEQKNRLNEQMNSLPQVSEVVDIRVDSNGKVYKVAKERIDAIQMSVEAAYRGNDGTVYNSLKDRFNDYDNRIGEVFKFKADGLTLTDKVLSEFMERGINVKWLGAKGDGVNLDASFIQQALNLGGQIFIPPGTYLIEKTMYVSANTKITLHPDAVLKRISTDTAAIFINGKPGESYGGYAGNGDITIEGGTLDLNGKAIQKTCAGISFAHAENIVIRDMKIKDTYNSHHIEINSSRYVYISNCKFQGYHHDGSRAYAEAIQIDLAKNFDVYPFFGNFDKTVCENITIENCNFKDVGRGIGTHVSDVMIFHDTVYILNNTFENLLDAAINCLIFRKVNISNNKIYNCLRGIHLENTYEGFVTDNHIKGCTTNGLHIANSNTIAVKGNHITNCKRNGMTIFNNSHSLVVSSCFIHDNGDLGMNIEAPNTIVTECIVKRNGSHGIYVHDTNNIKISNSYVHENKRNGIVLSSATSNFIENNFVYANNQMNDGSSNIVINTGSTGNRLVNNKIRAGSLIYKPSYGLYIGNDSSSSKVFMNDFVGGGKVADFVDVTNTAMLDTNTDIQKGTLRSDYRVQVNFQKGVVQKLPLGTATQNKGNIFTLLNNAVTVNKAGTYYWRYYYLASDDFNISNAELRFNTYVNGSSAYLSDKMVISSSGQNIVSVSDMVWLEAGDKLEIYMTPYWSGTSDYKTKTCYFVLLEA